MLVLLCAVGEKRQPEGSYLGREPAGPPREGRQPRAPRLGGFQHMKPDHSLLLSSHKHTDSYRVPVVLLREAQAAKRNTRTKRVDDIILHQTANSDLWERHLWWQILSSGLCGPAADSGSDLAHIWSYSHVQNGLLTLSSYLQGRKKDWQGRQTGTHSNPESPSASHVALSNVLLWASVFLSLKRKCGHRS